MLQSLPSWERGLKLQFFALLSWFCLVAPLVGAWIEIEPGINMETRDGSLPSWERGLKSLISLFKIPLTMSLPSWERGLKLLYNYPVVRQTIVAPLVGAWIEIVPVS